MLKKKFLKKWNILFILFFIKKIKNRNGIYLRLSPTCNVLLIGTSLGKIYSFILNREFYKEDEESLK